MVTGTESNNAREWHGGKKVNVAGGEMIKDLSPLGIAILIIFFGSMLKRKKEKENIGHKTRLTVTGNTAKKDINKNLKTGDALNFSSYEIPEIKGFHFEAGRGYVKNKDSMGKRINPATGLLMNEWSMYDICGNFYGLSDISDFNDDW
jgi:hypothetical protein